MFGTIDPDGSRLTDLAERARMTKQTVGEAATDLERRGKQLQVTDQPFVVEVDKPKASVPLLMTGLVAIL